MSTPHAHEETVTIFGQELARVMAMTLDGQCICSEPDRARSAFQCPVHQEEHPL